MHGAVAVLRVGNMASPWKKQPEVVAETVLKRAEVGPVGVSARSRVPAGAALSCGEDLVAVVGDPLVNLLRDVVCSGFPAGLGFDGM